MHRMLHVGLVVSLASVAANAHAEPRCQVSPDKPTLEVYVPERLEVGEPERISISARDPAGTHLTVTATDLPSGATLELDPPQKQGCETTVHGTIIWTPTYDDLGKHTVRFTATTDRDKVEVVQVAEVVEEFRSFMMPGLQYSVYLPKAMTGTGGFQGASAEFLLDSWVHRNENHGPSHVRIYADLDLLVPVNSTVRGNLYSYTLGCDLSIERNPKRRFLIPYYGVEAGGLYQAQYGQVLQVVPFAGVHLWESRNIWVNASAGYLLPGRALDALGGFRGKLGVDFSLW